MNKNWRKLVSLVLALSLVLSMAVFGSGAIDLTQPCTLSVKPGSDEYLEDLEKAHVVVDLYQVAAAAEVPGYDTYSYQLMDPYTTLTITDDMDNADWKALNQSAAAIALSKGTPVVKGKSVSETISATDGGENLLPGLYLLIAYGSDVAEDKVQVETTDEDGNKGIGTIAHSPEYVYTFSPELISLPGKAADEEGNYNTANPGEWLYNMEVTLKPEQDIRYGKLEIIKTLQSYETSDDAIFVFDVEAKIKGEVVFSDSVALNFSAPGQKKVLLERIPVGAEVTVTEVYEGSSYKLTSDNKQTATIDATKLASVSFTNDYDEEHKSGHGITNHFTHPEGADHWNDLEQLEDNAYTEAVK